MNRIDRLTAMILMLQSHRVVTAEQISEHFEMSVRTVYRDIAALGEAGVPIIAEAGVGYALMRGYHMPPVMFTEEEAAALFMSGEVTEKFGDGSLKKSLRSAMLKIRAALPAERKDYLGRLGNSMSIQARSEDSEDDGYLMRVQEAVVRRRCVRLQYNTAGRGEVSDRTIEPLGVIFYGQRWHLIGWCQMRKGFRDFRLDRIQGCEVLSQTFAGHEDFSLMEFVSCSIRDHDLIPVAIECENWALDRVLAEMPAQFIKRVNLPDGQLRVEAMAYSLDWMARWLLGIGTGARVSEPQELREKVAGAALKLAAHYGEKSPLEKDS